MTGAMTLARKVAALNPAAGEVGAGMLAQLVTDARRIVGPCVCMDRGGPEGCGLCNETGQAGHSATAIDAAYVAAWHRNEAENARLRAQTARDAARPGASRGDVFAQRQLRVAEAAEVIAQRHDAFAAAVEALNP